MIKFTGKLALGLATVVAAVGLSAAPASAVPTNCHAGTDGGNWAYAICTAGYGQYRVWIDCWNDNGRKTTLYGTWMDRASGDGQSVRHCNATYPIRENYGYHVQ
ncbi:hypothetical protein AB0883_14835 [Micromonospora sp. NPDC047812]|uniref:hypothetical protein n=1 Tax=Micromonospora sp. NPDC047812 TaxID=3155742 RepID=UPI0034552D80